MRSTALLWLAALAIVAVATLSFAQVQAPTPRILSGPDVGFRVTGIGRDGKPLGAWVVRLNGEWVEPSPGMIVRPATE